MSKRDVITIQGKSHYAQRDARGRFIDITNVGDSIQADRRKRTRKHVKPGHGHEGDLPRRKRS